MTLSDPIFGRLLAGSGAFKEVLLQSGVSTQIGQMLESCRSIRSCWRGW